MREKLNVFSPFNISCETGDEKADCFSYAALIDHNRTYYHLKNNPDIYVASCVVSRCDNRNNVKFKSRFSNIMHTEKFHFEKFGVFSEYNGKGIMTIMFCDIILAILKREMAYHNNIEIKLKNNSVRKFGNKIINVYKTVLPGYRLSIDKPKSKNMMLERKVEMEDIKYFNDIYYLFPLYRRKEDIDYYTALRNSKLKHLKL